MPPFHDDDFLREELARRKLRGLLRSLPQQNDLWDFCSNDYLGFAATGTLAARIARETEGAASGATGSRLISGNSPLCEEVEREIAAFHGAESALIFNSGYDANIGLFSAVPRRGDTVLFDELVHASIRDGIRLSFARNFSFRHNDARDLKKKIGRARGRVFVAVESVYSMDGDRAPLVELAALCREQGARLCVDEAHATGVLGRCGVGAVSELGLEREVFARVHTFGKALGCHGAAVLGADALRSYLINFARSFIYTTALPPASIAAVRAAYRLLAESDQQRRLLESRIALFLARLASWPGRRTSGVSAIQGLLFPGNDAARRAAAAVQARGFDVRPILSPTVPAGRERLRVCLHSFNSDEQVSGLAQAVCEFGAE